MKGMILFFFSVLLIMNLSIAHVEAMDRQKLVDLIDNDPALEGALLSVSVRSAKTGEVLYEHLANTRLRPASNMKLFTAAAALSVLGEHHRFTTELYMDGKIKWKILDGDLYIKGNGDPTLLGKDIDELVRQLKIQGVRIIKGNLIADDSRYDDERYPIDLPWSDEETYYGAQVSALTVAPDDDYEAGTVVIEVTPGKEINDKGEVTVSPGSDTLMLVNKSTTIEANQKLDLKISREHGTNVIYIDGVIPKNASTHKESIAIWEPTDYVLHLFKQTLKEQGITLLGSIKKGKLPLTAKKLTTHESMPLSELLVPFMKQSNNGHAEILIKEMGYVREEEGTWDKGLNVLEEELKQWNIETEKMVIRDGSGISHVSGIPTHQISGLLYEIQAEPWFSIFLQSLPLVDGGVPLDRGTLNDRLKQTVASRRVRAKTGTLTTVSSLAGYVEPKEGEALVFSIISNQIIDGDKAKDLEDQLVLALLE
ncbi:D-alanyl-D-alanine carboxypeptidase/D-alanyl-D-alanine endopeptidase [Alkalihalobacillus deserti]|uniref:D-alanyl-D-alanine carboxypeptidase/D-alanyl-D-alanine endopeptidase n=1 Tax=Alkalihalobacillus deserti TaxID=2879466 RepID=UPI001D13C615|nr:D-alanyl-D-alanine carboxypeptidase/D-alanyl-D-alanine-endopeptidase [Alkalihalobacillus deserti]